LGQSRRGDGAMLIPTKSLLLLRVVWYLCVTLGENRSINATVRMRTDRRTHILTNWIYNLSRAICGRQWLYSVGYCCYWSCTVSEIVPLVQCTWLYQWPCEVLRHRQNICHNHVRSLDFCVYISQLIIWHIFLRYEQYKGFKHQKCPSRSLMSASFDRSHMASYYCLIIISCHYLAPFLSDASEAKCWGQNFDLEASLTTWKSSPS